MFLDGLRALPESREFKSVEDIRRADPVVLAYIGDTLYDLYIRVRLAHSGNFQSGRLHTMAIPFVCASGQAAAFDRLLGELNEDEQNIARRARNAKAGTLPKNCDPATYARATALEAVFGYLYLCRCRERLEELLEKAYEYASKGE